MLQDYKGKANVIPKQLKAGHNPGSSGMKAERMFVVLVLETYSGKRQVAKLTG